MRKSRILALILVVLMLCAAMAGCGKKEDDVIEIGLITPLTGEVAVYGVAVENAVKMYIDELNDAGGIDGKKVKLIVYDDKGEAVEATNAYNKLVTQDEVVAILGPVTSTPTLAVAPLSVDDGIPCLTPTGTHPDITSYSDNFFRSCFEDPFQGGTIADYAFNELDAKTAGIIYNASDSYSTGLMEAFTAKAEALGMEVVATEAYGKGDVDFKAQLTNISAANPDVLFIPDYYENCYKIALQVKEVGLDVTLLGVDGTDGVLQIEGADTSVFEGMYFPNHYAADDTGEKVVSFRAGYTALYNETPNALAALGYDGAIIMCQALKAAAADGADLTKAGTATYDKIKAALYKTDIEGVTGKITIDANGNPIKDCTIITITGGAYRFVTKY